MLRKPLFAPADLDRIATAVDDAERKTAGEIVPYFVKRSDDYEEAVWRAGFLGVGGALTVFLLFRAFTEVCCPST